MMGPGGSGIDGDRRSLARARLVARFALAEARISAVTHAGRMRLLGRVNERLGEVVSDVERGRPDVLLADSLGGALHLIGRLEAALADIRRWLTALAGRAGIDPDQAAADWAAREARRLAGSQKAGGKP